MLKLMIKVFNINKEFGLNWFFKVIVDTHWGYLFIKCSLQINYSIYELAHLYYDDTLI
jgi:hypothetical protein